MLALCCSYLVAWVIGNLSHVEGTVPSPYAGEPDRPVRIFATPQKYARALAIECL